MRWCWLLTASMIPYGIKVSKGIGMVPELPGLSNWFSTVCNGIHRILFRTSEF